MPLFQQLKVPSTTASTKTSSLAFHSNPVSQKKSQPLSKVLELNEYLNHVKNKQKLTKKLQTKALGVRKDKCPLLHRFRNTAKTLHSKGNDG